jgi:hypothetical protein
MSFIDNISLQDLEFRESGLFTPEIDKYDEVAVSIFDLSTANYNAAGLEGWGNRAMALSAPFNPLVGIETWRGNFERNLRTREETGEGSVLGSAVKAVGQASWDVLVEGFLMGGLMSFERLATGAFIGLYAGVDFLADVKEGNITGFAENYSFTDFFDLEKLENQNAGQMVVLNLFGIASIIAPGVSREAIGDFLGYLPFTDPIEWLRNDFDPLNEEDIALFHKEGQMRYLTYTANFIGWVVFDPLSWVTGGKSALLKLPFLASGKYSYGFSSGKQGLKNFKREGDELRQIETGNISGVDGQTLKQVDQFVNVTDLSETKYLLETLGAQGQIADNLAYLLANAKSREQVATILLSTQWRDRNSIAKMRDVYLANEKASSWFAFDNIVSPGGAAKTFDPKLGPFSGNNPTNAVRQQKNREYLDEVEPLMDEFKNIFENVLSRGGTVGEELAYATTITQRTMRSTGIYTAIPGVKDFYTGVRFANARFRASVIRNDSEIFGVQLIDSILGKTIVKLYSKFATTSLRGAIDFANPGNTLTAKAQSFLLEADKATGGILRATKNKDGVSQYDELLSLWYRATTPEARREFFDTVHMITLIKLLEKTNQKGLLKDPEKMREFVNKFYAAARQEQNRKTLSQIDNQFIELAGSGTIEIEQALRGLDRSVNWYQTLDLQELARHLQKSTTNFERSKFTDVGHMVEQTILGFNSAWAVGILFRPARFFRERLANGLGTVLSGLNFEFWVLGHNQAMIKNLYENISTKASLFKKSREMKKKMYDVNPDGTLNVNKENFRQTVKTQSDEYNALNKSIEQAEAAQQQLLDSFVNSGGLDGTISWTVDTKRKHQYAREILQVEPGYHGTAKGFDVDNLDSNTFVPLSKNQDTAAGYADNFGRAVEPGVTPVPATRAQKLELSNKAKSENRADRIEAAQNSNTSKKDLNTLADDSDIFVRMEVAANPKTPTETLNKLANSPDLEIQLTVASNPKTPTETLNKLAKENNNKAVIMEVASNSNTEIATLNKLAKSSDLDIQISVAYNTSTPTETLTKLANSSDLQVKSAVALNRNTSPETLSKLVDEAYPQMLKTGSLLWEDVLMSALKNPNFDAKRLNQFAKSSDLGIQLAVAANPKVSAPALKYLSGNTTASVRKAVASNKKTDKNILATLAEDGNVSVRLAVAKNRNTDNATLKKLAEDPDIQVRETALINNQDRAAYFDAETVINAASVNEEVLSTERVLKLSSDEIDNYFWNAIDNKTLTREQAELIYNHPNIPEYIKLQIGSRTGFTNLENPNITKWFNDKHRIF